MNIEYFGWLTKGKYDVSLLDYLILVAEIGLIIFVFYCYLIIKNCFLKISKALQGKEDTQTYCKDCGIETKSGNGSARCPDCWDDRFGGKE